MKHLGDITKINGAEADPVNVIIGGSPCQDLSVAGKRAGLAGERSGLFMEQLRIIKEMRQADVKRGRTGDTIRPRFMVWENVPGAFSSNKGADFGAVLQETIKVVNEKAPVVPMPKNGWPTAGCITDVGGQWSIAWRVLDAQFWGVPQRRRRISLIADFGGLRAPEILFERESVPGNYTPCRASWPRVAAYSQEGFDFTGKQGQQPYCLQGNGIDRADNNGCNGKGWTEDVSYTLNTIDRHAVAQQPIYAMNKEAWQSGTNFDCNVPVYDNGVCGTLVAGGVHGVAVPPHIPNTIPLENHPNDSRLTVSTDGNVQTLTQRMGTGGGNVPLILEQK